MSEKKTCPDCGTRLTHEGMTEVHDNYYQEYWACPNYENHGVLVPCANGCGEDVRNARQHYYSRDGVIGGGRWMCVPRRQIEEAVENWLGEGGVPGPDDKNEGVIKC